MNIKSKGNAGENEACVWLSKNLFDGQVMPKRNLAQSFVGCDIVQAPFIFEIKRVENLNYNKWWIQVNIVSERLLSYRRDHIPVVMFRQNRKPWEFLISAKTIGCDVGWVHINQVLFLKWGKRYIQETVPK